ncbi:cytochrome b [Rickettsiales bacterium]|nr:cytochrome b [Rickettsiales bacterium]
MNSDKNEEGKGIKAWIEYRLPIFSFINNMVGRKYPAPKNLSYAWNFGVLAGLGLLIQIITGIFLAMHYTPHVDYAFDSVEHIMRDVHYGWLIRYCHAVGASFFFIVVYVHILRGLYYGSYKKPRELLWFIGVFIFLVMMATAFMGYVLPWGQMSFWGVTVITSLFSAIPLIGDQVVTWLWGGYSVDNPTLNRFFALHYLLPFIIVALAMLHIAALHRFGSNNPSGVEVKSSKDTIPFHPYYTIKDLVGVGFFLIIFSIFLFYIPNYLGHPDNYTPADPMVTPAHIVPEWYFLPFYAILRAVPSKIGGVITMFSAILILLFLPWLDTSEVKSGRYRPVFKCFFWLFALDFIALGWLGSKGAEEPYITMGRISTMYYFAYFLVILPILGKYEKPLNLPESLSEATPHMK